MRTGQSKKMSFVESLCNVATGLFVATVANYYVLNWFGHHVDLTQSTQIALIFTAISILRSYVLRRIFNMIFVREQDRYEHGERIQR